MRHHGPSRGTPNSDKLLVAGGWTCLGDFDTCVIIRIYNAVASGNLIVGAVPTSTVLFFGMK
jgi:hypothetical protein